MLHFEQPHKSPGHKGDFDAVAQAGRQPSLTHALSESMELCCAGCCPDSPRVNEAVTLCRHGNTAHAKHRLAGLLAKNKFTQSFTGCVFGRGKNNTSNGLATTTKHVFVLRKIGFCALSYSSKVHKFEGKGCSPE